MAKGEKGEGEGLRAGRARQRERMIISVLALAGALTIGAIVTFGRLYLGLPPGRIPAWAAVTGAIALPVVFVATEWALWRSTDEFDRLAALRAARIALYTYLNVQISWVLLAQGGFVHKPDGLLMMIGVMLVYLAAYQILRRAR